LLPLGRVVLEDGIPKRFADLLVGMTSMYFIPQALVLAIASSKVNRLKLYDWAPSRHLSCVCAPATPATLTHSPAITKPTLVMTFIVEFS
jgi:hypothetical protein